MVLLFQIKKQKMKKILIEIPKYIREIEVSKKRREIYWSWTPNGIVAKNKKLSDKYVKDTRAVIDNYGKVLPEHLKDDYALVNVKGSIVQGYSLNPEFHLSEGYKVLLADKKTYQPIVANPNVAGKPNILQIKGQDMYNGKVREHAKGTIMKAIQNSFRPYVKLIPPITFYPLKITMELYDTVKNIYDRSKDPLGGRWDVDNRAYPYLKAFPDVLYQEGIIKDDDRLHITCPPATEFCPIDNTEDRKLVFIIEQDTRPIIMNKQEYDPRFQVKVEEDKKAAKQPKKKKQKEMPKLNFKTKK